MLCYIQIEVFLKKIQTIECPVVFLFILLQPQQGHFLVTAKLIAVVIVIIDMKMVFMYLSLLFTSA